MMIQNLELLGYVYIYIGNVMTCIYYDLLLGDGSCL
jgi:hypothetical protein